MQALSITANPKDSTMKISVSDNESFHNRVMLHSSTSVSLSSSVNFYVIIFVGTVFCPVICALTDCASCSPPISVEWVYALNSPTLLASSLAGKLK